MEDQLSPPQPEGARAFTGTPGLSDLPTALPGRDGKIPTTSGEITSGKNNEIEPFISQKISAWMFNFGPVYLGLGNLSYWKVTKLKEFTLWRLCTIFDMRLIFTKSNVARNLESFLVIKWFKHLNSQKMFFLPRNLTLKVQISRF